MFSRKATAAGVAATIALCWTLALPTANAQPQQDCNTTVGESIDSYLNRHPDVRRDLTERGRQESPGSPDPVLDYLNRHPNVRQALITLSQQCTS